jgi:drug/metabolite transporter (DMT)-like permease
MSATPTRAQILSRTAAGLLGSYAFVWGFASLATTLGVAAGMPYREARTLAFLVAFLVFLACFCWSFAAARAARVWAVLGGGGALMTGAALLLARAQL